MRHVLAVPFEGSLDQAGTDALSLAVLPHRDAPNAVGLFEPEADATDRALFLFLVEFNHVVHVLVLSPGRHVLGKRLCRILSTELYIEDEEDEDEGVALVEPVYHAQRDDYVDTSCQYPQLWPLNQDAANLV